MEEGIYNRYIHTSTCSLDGAKEHRQIRRCRAHADHALQELIQITRCRGSYGLGAAGAHADQALQGLMQIRRCRGSCRSGAAGADENKALQTLMQLRRCRARCIASCKALRERQHKASVSGFNVQVGGTGRQASNMPMMMVGRSLRFALALKIKNYDVSFGSPALSCALRCLSCALLTFPLLS